MLRDMAVITIHDRSEILVGTAIVHTLLNRKLQFCMVGMTEINSIILYTTNVTSFVSGMYKL